MGIITSLIDDIHFRRMFTIRYEGISSIKEVMIKWMNSTTQNGKNHIRLQILVIILWKIWKAGNETKFRGCHFKAWRIIAKIIHHIWIITLAMGWKRKHWKGDLSVSSRLRIHIPPNRF